MQPTRTAGPDRPGIAPAPFLFGLAPGGVCRAAAVAGERGALLPHRFTLTAAKTLRSRGGLFSVALSLRPARKPPRRTLSGTACPWSPDFPPRPPFGLWRGAAVRPTDLVRNGVGRGLGQAAPAYAVKKAGPPPALALSPERRKVGVGPVKIEKARTCREGDKVRALLNLPPPKVRRGGREFYSAGAEL